jgi:hypothetical protein
VRREGVTLPELLVVAWLLAFVLAAIARFAGAQSRLVAAAHDRARLEEALRVPRVVVAGELRALAGVDIAALSADSIRLRAVRGGGHLCAVDGSDAVVRYRGVRLPDPEKDSALLIVGSDPLGRPHPVVGVARDTACGGSLRLGLGTTIGSVGGWVLIFETGAYHLRDGTVRYRRGAGGRQPLTEGLFAGEAFSDLGAGGVALDLPLHPDSLVRAPIRTARIPLTILNRGAP